MAPLTRREILRNSVGGFLGFALARQTDLFGAPRPGWLLPRQGTRARARACIVLWMTGGPSQFETWSPKEGRETGGATKAVDTSVPGVRYAEHLKVCATQAHHIAVVRSMTSREGSHERGRYLLHTGYVPTGTVIHPSMGAITAMEIGPKEHDLPGYISIGGPSEGAGFLPPEYNPFVVGGREGRGEGSGPKIPDISRPKEVDDERFRARMKLLEMQEARFRKDRPSGETEKHRAAYAKADRLMHTPLLKAFDLSNEKPELAQAYGTSPFGRGCLLARRLVETGVPFVEVTLGGWDTHQENFTRAPELCGKLDPAMGTLIRDLHERRLLESTLVICMGEFGRTPRINATRGRDHYPRAWSLAMAGGGIQGGRVIGETDRDGVEISDRPVTVPDFMATAYRLLGVDLAREFVSPQGRPLKVTDSGTPVKELTG